MRLFRGSRLLAGVGVLVGAPLATLAFAGAKNASAVSPDISVVCTHLKGSGTALTAKVTGCPASSTGGKGAIVNFLPGGGNVTWLNGTTTDYTSTFKNPSTGCPSGSLLYKITGWVTSSTNGSTPVGGAVKMRICANQTTGALVNETGTTIEF